MKNIGDFYLLTFLILVWAHRERNFFSFLDSLKYSSFFGGPSSNNNNFDKMIFRVNIFELCTRIGH